MSPSSPPNLKGVFTPRPPRYPPALPQPSQFEALTATSATLLSFLKRLFFRTLRFFAFSLDSFSFSSSRRHVCSSHSTSSTSPSMEPLYLVPFGWWNDARAAMTVGSGGGDVGGVPYDVASSLSKNFRKDDWWWGLESEIVLEMRKADENTSENPRPHQITELHLALICDWMFLKAFKWHNETKYTGDFLSTEFVANLFSLQICLSYLYKTNSLIIKIHQKDNTYLAFERAIGIFSIDSSLLQIWDFSGWTSQIFINDRRVVTDLDQQDEDFCLELQIYGLIETREFKREKMMTDQFKDVAPASSSSIIMNGVEDSLTKFKQFPQLGGKYNSAYAMGLTGLNNLGNTCFMNSALQCLAHTSELVDYFLGDIRKDLNFDNPLGKEGKLALAFGELLRKLWAPGANFVSPSVLKSLISEFAPQFSGYSQHDSQEFLAFFLDGLHEDLNRVKNKPYLDAKDSDKHLDEEIADEHWQNHLLRNDSIIVDLCQGQYRSRLVCPVCEKKSVKFDPFLYLSLPLPSTIMRAMTLTIFSTDGFSLPGPITISVPKDGQLKDLVDALIVACSLRDDETLLVALVFDCRIVGFLDDLSGAVDLIRDEDQLIAYRLPKEIEGSSLVVFTHEREHKSQAHSLFPGKRFGVPLVSKISNLSKGLEIHKEFLKLLSPFLTPAQDSLKDYNQKLNGKDGDVTMMLGSDAEPSSKCESDSAWGSAFKFYLGGGFLSERFGIKMDGPVPSSTNLQVLVSWPQEKVKDYCAFSEKSLQQICSGLFPSKPQEFIPLYSCLDAFLKDEPLGPEDMWYCPRCETHRQASKKLKLWRLPDILVIHLKRFSSDRYFRSKLETFVDFPVDNLDLSDYIVQNNSQVSQNYSLYAISNHSGSMTCGHYTSYVKHGQNRWYEFDDNCVSLISEEQIKSSSAYVLFYRRISQTARNIVQ